MSRREERNLAIKLRTVQNRIKLKEIWTKKRQHTYFTHKGRQGTKIN